jgi:hypothetical protein
MWKIGDRVVVVGILERDHGCRLNVSVGDKGTIIAHEKYDNSYLIQFDRDINGHGGAMKGEKPLGKDGHCWWMFDFKQEEGILVSYNSFKCKRISKKRNNNFY